jgi:phosphoenolpyruvate carboxylase
VAEVCQDYSALSETDRRELLLGLLRDPRPLRVLGAEYSPLVQSELAIFEKAAALREAFGPSLMRHGIISHTESVSDLLEAMLLQKESGLMQGTLARGRLGLIVVPLFETIDDLERAEPIMRATKMAVFSVAHGLSMRHRSSWCLSSAPVKDSLCDSFTAEAEPSGAVAAQVFRPFARRPPDPSMAKFD